MMKTTLQAFVVVLLVCLPAFAFAQGDASGQVEVKAEAQAGADGGGPGESCRARADCSEGLKCVDQVCKDELEGSSCTSRADCGNRGLSCIDSKCVAPGSQSSSGGGGDGSSGGSGGSGRSGGGGGGDDDGDDGGDGGGGDVLDGDLEGLRLNVGMLLGGGPSHPDDPVDFVRGSLLWSLHGGVMLDRAEFGLEFAPATYVPIFDPDAPSVHLIGYGGYHIPVWKTISWPLRLGIGLTQVTFRGETVGDPLLALRADLIGISALLFDQLLVDVHLPSWRINIDPNNNAVGTSTAFFSYIFGVGISWVPKL